MPQRVGIIGYPIGHSISPAFQQAALDYCGIDARYLAWEVAPVDLFSFVQGLRSPDCLGCNVTLPHKEEVIPLLDFVDEWAARAEAVNTIVNEGGQLKGYNTDGRGFLRALQEHRHLSPRGLRVLVLGAGGAAKGVCLALAGEGAGAITVTNRTLRRAQALARLIEDLCPQVAAVPLEAASIRGVSLHCDLVVNCTTLGMKDGPGQGVAPLLAEDIPPTALVYDLVYNPATTPLLKEASRAGAAILGGLSMLVYQGAASFEMWTGREAPVDVMLKAAEEALR